MQIGPDVYPDYHFLLIAPNLGAEWFFDAARQYWERYRPTVISDFRFVALIPSHKTITVTVVARRDTVTGLTAQMTLSVPNAYYDPVIYELFDDAKAELNRRAEQSQPFGVPMSQPTPTYDPNLPIVIPTASRPPAFITQTPTPDGLAESPPESTQQGTPAPSFTPPESPPQRINPTPGPITGG